MFAGRFGLAEAAEVCCAGDQPAALEVVDGLVSKSLVVAQPAEDGTRYRLLETIREYAADQLAAAGTEVARTGTRPRSSGPGRAGTQPAVLSASTTISAPPWNGRWPREPDRAAAGPRPRRLLAGRGLLQEGRDWLERAPAQRPSDQRLRADLLRLLGVVLYEGGDLERADTVLSEVSGVAAAAGAPAAAGPDPAARRRPEQAGPGDAETLAECEAAAAVLEAGRRHRGPGRGTDIGRQATGLAW